MQALNFCRSMELERCDQLLIETLEIKQENAAYFLFHSRLYGVQGVDLLHAKLTSIHDAPILFFRWGNRQITPFRHPRHKELEY